MKRYAVIVSVATDFNRGDQALLWQAKQLIKDSLEIETVYVLENDKENLNQSMDYGLIPVEPILHHPSYRAKTQHEKNANYSLKLKLRWGFAGIVDFVATKLMLILKRPFMLNKKQKETFELIKNSDAVFVKGGGFIHSYGKLTDIYYIYYSLYHINLALALKKKVYVLPNSFGPFEGISIAKSVRKTLEKCELVSSRETISQDMLEKIGVKSEVYPDMAFMLESSKTQKAEEIIAKLNLSEEENAVAITVRPYRFPESSNPKQKYDEYLKAMVGFIDWLKDNGYRPILVEHTHSSNEHENDGKCISQIVDISERKIEVLSDIDLNCRELKHIYSKFQYIVGTRFHSVIFSLSENVPGIALSYSGNKSTGIMNDIGLGDFVLNANDLNSETLIETFKKLTVGKDEYKKTICDYCSGLQMEYEKLVCQIKEGKKHE